MKQIEVSILNPTAIVDAEKMMVAMARLTQRGAEIHDMLELAALLNRPYTDELTSTLAALPHPTLQKFGVINIAVVGASRRFLAQITRHQNEVKFMSGSLQYSDYTGKAQFVTPYEILAFDAQTVADGEAPRAEKLYHESCLLSAFEYEKLANVVGRDAAGYAMPQGMRNVLIISATPYQWKHMISQRICRRNTLETQYVMLRCWEELENLSSMFAVGVGPSCMQDSKCAEGKMSCKHYLFDSPAATKYAKNDGLKAAAILDVNFPLLR